MCVVLIRLFLVLSDEGSTASFDKNPQSQERGITIDLGFSVVHVNPYPERFKDLPYDAFQFTIVDCPGHASFIRTVIGGAQIIDCMLLVIDSVKGVQAQTAESLVIGELTTDHLVVALNKVDSFAGGENDPEFIKMRTKVAAILQKTKFSGCPMVAVSARTRVGLDTLLSTLVASSPLPGRTEDSAKRFLFAVDHCFMVKGQGTVMTGTVLRGSVQVNDTVEIADAKVSKKVKSMQMFKKPVTKASQGDRVGICVGQFPTEQMERGLLCHPGTVTHTQAVLASCQKIRYFGADVTSGTRFHISVGHRTATAKIFFLRKSLDMGDGPNVYEWQDVLPKDNKNDEMVVLLKFDVQILCPDDSLYIASKLDSDESAPGCRIAFHGKVRRVLNEVDEEGFEKTHLRVFKRKEKTGTIDRVVNDSEIIGRGLFKSNFDMNKLNGCRIVREMDGAVGEIRGNFGSSKNAKFKAWFASGGFDGMQEGQSKKLFFRFKRYVGQAKDNNKWIQ